MKSAFFNSVGKDRRYSAVDWAKYFRQFIGNGVYGANSSNMMVVPSSGMTVEIKAGSCFINGHCGYCDGETVILDVGGTSPRVDMVAARLDQNARDIHIYVAKGDGTNVPAPSRNSTYYDLVLAYVSVGAGATEITAANITDKRGDNTVCGWVTGIIDQIDTSALFSQYEARWDLLMAGFSGDEAAIIAAFNALFTVKSINGIAPADSGGNIALTLDDIPDGTAKKLNKTVQCGVATTASSDISGGTVYEADVVFETPFTSAPVVIVSCEDATNSSSLTYPTAAITNLTKDGFTVYTKSNIGIAKVHWIAMGV